MGHMQHLHRMIFPDGTTGRIYKEFHQENLFIISCKVGISKQRMGFKLSKGWRLLEQSKHYPPLINNNGLKYEGLPLATS